MELDLQLADFEQRGVQVIAAAVAPLLTIQSTQSALQIDFPILSDEAHEVAESYGVYNLLGDGYAAPAVLVIDTDGRIVWYDVGQDAQDRPPVAEILNHLP